MKFCPRCARPLDTRQDGGRTRSACPDLQCGFVFYDNPLPVVAALVEHQGEVLLVRNRGWPEKWFGLVAGFLERSETPEEGVLRELKEELGLDAVVVGLIGVYAFPERNEVILAYHLRATGTVVLGEEIAELRRVAPERLRAWPFGTGKAVADWLARRGA
jgi:NAD+ diphosphatase